jgi:hypothetical protein
MCLCLQMDPFTAETVKKKMMLERFQEEVSIHLLYAAPGQLAVSCDSERMLQMTVFA